MKTPRRLVASCLVLSVTFASLPAHAIIVPTEAAAGEALSSATLASARERVASFLSREDVRNALVGQGVSSEAALSRVAAMSDSEVAELADRIDSAPAGGDVLGLVFTVFVILLVTDILGLTKVFPFTRSVR
jgi:hypothetical protein